MEDLMDLKSRLRFIRYRYPVFGHDIHDIMFHISDIDGIGEFDEWMKSQICNDWLDVIHRAKKYLFQDWVIFFDYVEKYYSCFSEFKGLHVVDDARRQYLTEHRFETLDQKAFPTRIYVPKYIGLFAGGFWVDYCAFYDENMVKYFEIGQNLNTLDFLKAYESKEIFSVNDF